LHACDVRFGTSNILALIERSIAVIEEAPFLSEAQKRDILYNNAARFLRLSEEEIARHHAAGGRDGGIGSGVQTGRRAGRRR
jgi:hypothetical protein